MTSELQEHSQQQSSLGEQDKVENGIDGDDGGGSSDGGGDGYDDASIAEMVSSNIPRIRTKATKLLHSLNNQCAVSRTALSGHLLTSSKYGPTLHPPTSWLRQQQQQQHIQEQGNDDDDDKDVDHQTFLQSRSAECLHLDTYGFVVIPNFCSEAEVHDMKAKMFDLVETQWHCSGDQEEEEEENHNDDVHDGDSGSINENNNNSNTNKTKIQSFGTDAKSNTARGDYFLDSSNRVHYFAEPSALTPEGTLKPEFTQDGQQKKWNALNKVGHGLHLPPEMVAGDTDQTENAEGTITTNESVNPFCDYTMSSKLKELVTSFGYQDPVIPQSMYIFKQPTVGGTVHCHQDSTFLYTTPTQSCLGLWLALDNATLSNGCLWVRPYSHNEPVRRQFIRNPEYYNDGPDKPPSSSQVPKLTFRQLHDEPDVDWDGILPPISTMLGVVDDGTDEDIFQNDGVVETQQSQSTESNKRKPKLQQKFVPVECSAGDLVVFVGTLDHFSLPNISTKPRHTFQLHLVEGPSAGITWSDENWLQYPTTAAMTTATAAATSSGVSVVPSKGTSELQNGCHPAFLRLCPTKEDVQY